MIFADKLILLRKKNGLSQEALAEKLDVTRQAVSRWEGAQTYPDIPKIILISKMFGVSVDYLLKDEIEEENTGLDTIKENDIEERKLDREEATSYLKNFEKIALYYAVFVAMFISGPIVGLSVYLAVYVKNGYSSLFAPVISAMGVWVIMWVAALTIFIFAVQKSRKGRQIINTPFELNVDTEEYLLSKMQKYAKTFLGLKITAICLTAVAIVLVVLGIIFMDVYSNEDMLIAFLLPSSICIMSALSLLEFHIALKRALDRLMQKGNYDENALKKKRAIILSVLYWIIVAVVFAVGKNLTKEWYFSCVFLGFAVLIYFSVLIATVVFRSNPKKK